MKHQPANAPHLRSTRARSSFSDHCRRTPRWLLNLWRWLLILALLLPSAGPGLVPSTAQAAEAEPSGDATASSPTQTETEPISVETSVPGVQLAARLSSEAAAPGEVVTLTVTLENPASGRPAGGLVLETALPRGLVPVERGDATIVRGLQPRLRWSPGDLAAGARWEGHAQVRLAGHVIDRALNIPLALRGAARTVIGEAQAQLLVRHPGAAGRVGPDGGVVASSDGRIRIEVPRGAVGQLVELRYTPRRHIPGTRVFYSFDLDANVPGGPVVTEFARPLKVTVRYTDAEIAGLVESSLRLAWSHPDANRRPAEHGEWPTVVEAASNTLTAQVSHFSTQSVSGDPATIVPASINDFQVGLYSGSASFALPLDLPPGAAGLAPRLEVRYDSSRVNRMYDRYSQAGWLGVGWGLNLGSVNWTDNPDGGAYAINFNGLNGDLSLQDDGFYHTRRESYARIQFVGTRTDHNQNSEWRVWSKEGTRYTFGGSSDARLWSCAGTEIWKLKKITDTAGNTITIDYQTNDRTADGVDRCTSPNESYPQYIRYSTNPGTADAQTNEFTVEFAVSERPFIRADSTRLYETMKLDSITLKNAASQIVRRWVFSFADAAPPTAEDTAAEDVLLTHVTTYGAGGTTALPAMEFGYTGPSDVDWGIPEGQGPARRQYLQTVKNAYGGEIGFGYTRWTADKASTEQHAEGYQVSQRTASGKRSEAPVITDTYSYGGAQMAWESYAFIGYEVVTHTDLINTQSVSRFWAYGGIDNPRNGLLLSQETRAGGTVRARLENTYCDSLTTTWRTRPVPLLETRRTITEELGTPRSYLTRYSYDGFFAASGHYDCGHPGNGYGNPRQTLEYGEVSADFATNFVGDERTSLLEYAYHTSTDAYIVDRPIKRELYEGIGTGGALAARSYFYYDSPPGSPQYGYVGPKGQLSHQSTLIELGQPDRYAQTRYTYDAFGNPATAVDANNNTTTTFFDDSTYLGFPTRVMNAAGLAARTEYDWTRVVVSATLDLDNQDQTAYRYDDWGRPTKVIRPGDSEASPTLEYQYLPGNPADQNPISKVLTWARESAGGPPRDPLTTRQSATFYDGLGRLIESKTEGPAWTANAEQYVVALQTYNSRGLPETVTQPFFSTQVPLATFVAAPSGQPATVTAYDALGRVDTITEPANRVTGHDYLDAGRSRVVDPLGRKTEATTDGLGRVTGVYEFTGTNAQSWAPYRHTLYSYNALDLLEQVATYNPASQTPLMRSTTIDYDLRGLKIAMSDPDMGQWRYRYDPAGNMLQQANQRTSENVTCLYYDSLNRPLGRSFATGDLTGFVCPASSGPYTHNYVYENLPGTTDAQTNNGYGRLRRVWTGGTATSPQIAHDYNYDNRGRLASEVTTADGRSYTLGYAYDAMDRVTATTYPDGELVTSTYNPMGQPATLQGTPPGGQPTTYVTAASYTAHGALDTLGLGNGVTTDYTYLDQAGGDQSQRLWKMVATKGSSTLLNLEYGYDAVSNVTSQVYSSPSRGESLTYTYDDFDRLKSVISSYPATAETGTYEYDKLDRITRLREEPFGDVTPYVYPTTPGPGQPLHAPQSFTFNATTSYNLTYDEAGNMLTRWVPGGSQYRHCYDGDNRLVSVEQNGASCTGPMAALGASSPHVMGAPIREESASATAAPEIESAAVTTESVLTNFGELPLSFIPNAGQSDPAVRFSVQALGGSLFFTPREVAMVLPHHSGFDRDRQHGPDRTGAAGQTEGPPAVVRLRYLGANPSPAITSTTTLPGVANYLIGNDPAAWRTNLPTYAGIVYRELYPGIDARYEGSEGQLKSTYTVAPRANPGLIRWHYAGATGLRVDDASGDLLISLPAPAGRTSGATLIERAPVAWQDIGGQRIPVAVRYRVEPGGHASFVLGAYDATHPLVIDPSLSYSTYLSGSGSDDGYAITVDSAGNAYVAGFTYSADFPSGSSPYAYQAYQDAFVTKLNPTGTAILFRTFLGGNSYDHAFGVAVPANGGSVVLAGVTQSSGFPVPATVRSYDRTFGGGTDSLGNPADDAFVVKLSGNGASVLYSTFLGGDGDERARAVRVGLDGRIYITGESSGGTGGSSFPLKNGFATQYGGGAYDAIVARINPSAADDLSTLEYSSYLGGSGRDEGHDLVMLNRRVYVTGLTASTLVTQTLFPTTAGLGTTHGGGRDAFVTKIDTAIVGSASLTHSRFLGGSGDDAGYAIFISTGSEPYVVGSTKSDNFPTANAYDDSYNGAGDVFVARLDNRFRGLLYSSYLGGAGTEWATGVMLDSSGKLYLAGSSESVDFPTVSELYEDKGADNCGNPPCPDVVIAKLDPGAVGSASLHFSTYLGGDSIDFGEGIALDSNGNVYVVGTTFSEDFPTTAGVVGPSPDNYPDRRDVIVAKISLADLSPETASMTRYGYDTEGRRVTATVNGVTTTYVGGVYERQGNSTRKHYYFGGRLVAVRQHGVLSYLLADHLGSTSLTLDSTGTAVTAMTSYVTTGSSAA